MAAADLVIARGGALTVAEICASSKPAIYIPFPFAVGNHQYYNAKAVVDFSGGIIIEEKELLSYLVIEKLDRSLLDSLFEAQRKSPPNHMGDNTTKDFMLRHVFGIAAELIGDEVELLRALLRLHYGKLVADRKSVV